MAGWDITEIVSGDITDAPQKIDRSKPTPNLICKDSWPEKGKNPEHYVFRQVSGRFGVPKLWCVFLAIWSSRAHSFISRGWQKLWSNASLLEGSTPWTSPLDSKDKTSGHKEERERFRMYYETIGTHLDEVKTPYEMLETVLHGIIGLPPRVILSSSAKTHRVLVRTLYHPPTS